MISTPFKRLVRFENSAGKILYGEVTSETPFVEDLIGSKVVTYDGRAPWDPDWKLTSTQDVIAKVSYCFLQRNRAALLASVSSQRKPGLVASTICPYIPRHRLELSSTRR